MIEALGARGDGIARLDDLCVFVPLTLPGDRLTVRGPEALDVDLPGPAWRCG